MLRILLLVCLLSTGLAAQEAMINDFIKTHRRGEENVAVKVPGWLIGLASSIAVVAVEEPDEKAVMRLLGDVGTTRVVTFLNEDFPEPGQSIGNLIWGLERYKGFERWADIRTAEGERVTVTARYRKQTIRDLVVVVREAERTVLVAARTDLKAEDLGRLIKDLEEM